MAFEAAFSGTECNRCEERVREGQMIEYDATNRIVHVICPETIEATIVYEQCPRCWTELPASGVCGACD